MIDCSNVLPAAERRHAMQVRSSATLAAVLQLALALGNFLNWGTRLGAAPGFRLRNLPKLQACRPRYLLPSIEGFPMRAP